MPEQFDKIREGIAKSLKGKHPEWTTENIKSISFAIATKRWQEKYGKNPSGRFLKC